jgi:hypothetical protein
MILHPLVATFTLSVCERNSRRKYSSSFASEAALLRSRLAQTVSKAGECSAKVARWPITPTLLSILRQFYLLRQFYPVSIALLRALS